MHRTVSASLSMVAAAAKPSNWDGSGGLHTDLTIITAQGDDKVGGAKHNGWQLIVGFP